MTAPANDNQPPTIDWASIPEETTGSVYVVGFNEFVKIGRSETPRRRIKSIDSNMPTPISFYGIVPGNWFVERLYHNRFSEHRVRGEWFKKLGILADWITGGCPKIEFKYEAA